MTAFSLDPRLDADTHSVTEFSLCSVRLMDDARWPWLILVPRADGAEELFDLTPQRRSEAMLEACLAGEKLKAISNCEKINIAAIGNVVRQLHIHVVARIAGDENWPGPVWGYGERVPYDAATQAGLVAHLRAVL